MCVGDDFAEKSGKGLLLGSKKMSGEVYKTAKFGEGIEAIVYAVKWHITTACV